MVNTLKLKAKIILNEYTQKKLADDLGMSVNTLNAKVNGRKSFSVDDAALLCELLHIDTPEEKAEIFLAQSSQK